MTKDWNKYREKIIGLGDESFKKSYYPELQNKISELEQAYLNLQTIFNKASDAIIIHDNSGKIYGLNPEAEKILNINKDEKQKINLIDFSISDQDKNILSTIWEKALNGEAHTFEWTILQNETHKEIPVHISINNSTWYGNQVLVAVIRDFTERKSFEKKLIEAKERANESDRLKSAFLANMSHEIRTPMNGIIGFSKMLSNGELKEDTRNLYTKIIIESSIQLLNIVNDILDISMIESNTIKLNINNVDINEIVNELFESYNIQNPDKSIEFKLIKSLNDKESTILTDKSRLNQILSNLLNNAFKFTSEGKISFGYEIIDNNLQFFVQDTGIGISKDQQEKIFERFRQADMDYTRKYGGTGLGLSISKKLTELLGGHIWVESEENMGSKFFFTIPFKHAEGVLYKQEILLPNKNTNNLTVLIAEDEDINYFYLEEILSNIKIKILRAKDGKEAVEICQSNSEIDLVLMDIKLPVMNGFDATRNIKTFRPHLPIIAQTAYAMADDQEKVLEAGCDDYISKPIIRENLMALIAKHTKTKKT